MNISDVLSSVSPSAMLKLIVIATIVFCYSLTVNAQGLPVGDEIPGARIDWHPDGTMLAVSDDLTVQIIDATTRQPINTLPEFADFVTDVKWSADGNELAIATRFNVQIWEQPWSTVDAQLVLNIQIPIIISPEIDYGILAVDWHPDPGQNQLLGVTPPGVTIWDTVTGQTVQSFPPSPGELLSATWSSDGSKVALGEITGRIYVYSFMTQEYEMAEVFDYSAIRSLAWKADDTMIAAGTSSGRVQLLTLEPFLGGAGTLDMPTFNIIALDWNPTVDELLATGDTEGNLVIWSLSPVSRIVHETQQAGAVASVVWSPDGSQLAYSDAQGGVEIIPAPDISNEPPVADAGPDQTVTVADGISGQVTLPLSFDVNARQVVAVEHIGWSSDGTRIFAVYSTDELVILDVTSGQTLFQTPLTGNFRDAMWHPTDSHLLAIAEDNLQTSIASVSVMDISSGQSIASIDAGESVRAIAWNSDGTKLAIASGFFVERNLSRMIKIWDIHSGQIISEILVGLDEITSLSWSSNDNLLVSSALDTHVRIWDPDTGEQLSLLTGHINAPRVVRWSPDGNKLASVDVGSGATLRLWDAETGTTMLTIPDVGAFKLEWNPDGVHVATTDLSNIVNIWNTTTGQLTSSIADSLPVYTLAWNPTGDTLALGSASPELKFIQFPTADAGPDQTVTAAQETWYYMLRWR